MPHTSINTQPADEILQRISLRTRGRAQQPNPVPYDSRAFEEDVRALLEKMFPFSVLSGLRLFSPTNRVISGALSAAALESEESSSVDSTLSDWGFEMDHLFHFRSNGDDVLVVIETKNQSIKVDGDQWLATYGTETKCAKAQVGNHIKVLWEYLEPISRPISLRFIGIVCCAESTPSEKATGKRNSELLLTSVEKLPQLIAEAIHSQEESAGDSFEVFRVGESNFLNLLRMSLPVQELGHPELSSAIRYVERCRRAVDDALFQHFEPTPERWVINGSAGMGKSVLLAYTAAVICSGHGVSRFEGEDFVHEEKKLEKLQLKLDDPDQVVVVMAMSGKQMENLKGWFYFFVERFRRLDKLGQIRVLQPEFELCRDGEKVRKVCQRASALLVDEAHDLKEFAAKAISEGHIERGFYLVVACDRHQKLRLSKDDARIIKGLDFSLKSKRLKQIYRNPIPIYIVSLALMFRWGAKTGPKVMPTWGELKEGFGFKVNSLPGLGQKLSIMSDAHPANSWSHSVVLFPSAESIFNTLASENLSGSDVLWVRFSEEDPDFNYEKLSRFTYHNCRTAEAQELSDKYVKGQEFPVVVIEGFPSFVDKFDSEQDEAKTWAFRREIYLCASRATCFLYFLCNSRNYTEENQRFREELKTVIDSVTMPDEASGGGTRKWSLFVPTTTETRKLDVFDDAKLDPGTDASPPAATEVATSTAAKPAPEKPAPPAVTKSPSEPVPRPFEELLSPVLKAIEPAKAEQIVEDQTEETPSTKPEPTPEASRWPQKVSPWIFSELTAEQLEKLPPLAEFPHSISIPIRISVMDLARKLGIHHRDVITDGTRMKLPLRGGTVLGPELVRRIAAVHGFSVEIEAKPNSSPDGDE